MKPGTRRFIGDWHASRLSAMGMRMHVLSRCPWWSLLAFGLGAVAACTSSSGSSAATVYPTTVSVRPSSFAGDVPCSPAPGGWKAYVATLTDVTDPTRPFQLPSSPPVACNMPVYFYFVMPGHSYSASIEGYDRSDIVAYGAPNSGSPHMVDPKTGQDVEPRWRASCPSDLLSSQDAGPSDDAGADPDAALDAGDDAASGPSIPGAAFCTQNLDVQPGMCSTLLEVLPPVASSISIDLKALRQGLDCGASTGAIDHYRVIPIASAHQPVDSACDQNVTFTPVTAGLTYHFRVEAYEKDAASARWATSCSAVAQHSLGVTAVCDTLGTDGALTVEIGPLLQAAGHVCAPDDIVSYRAVIAGSTTGSQPSSCAQDATWSPLSAGAYQIVVEGLDASEQVSFAAFCEASVTPAAAATATCTVQ
jgi:hypothetical protein